MKNYKKSTQGGFTLIELLIVIAILTILFAITIVAVNPARQFSQANDAQRRSDVSAILNSISQYAADNRGQLPAFIPSTSTQMVSDTATSSALCSVTCGATTTTAFCLPLQAALVPTYIAAMPYDPLQTNASTTHYAVTRSAQGNRITVSSCSPEVATTISVTR